MTTVRLLELASPISASPISASPSWTDQLSAVGAVLAAAAALATVVVAVVAARYAKKQVTGIRDQVTEAQTARREQAQPYVVAYAEVSPAHPHFADLVIRNLGSTGAANVRLRCTPELRRSATGGETEPVRFPDATPFLAPGQEWRTLWDFGPGRANVDLPDRYEFTATYTDYMGQEHSTPSVLDWGFFRHRIWTTRRTVHDAAEALETIATVLRAWSQRDEVVRVATYDGDSYDRKIAAAEEAHVQRMRDFRKTLAAQQAQAAREEEGTQNG